MFRTTFFVFALAGCLTQVSAVWADVSVRVPFVQVEVGGPGVYVRAPFVRLFVPANRPMRYVPANQPVIIGEPLPAPKELQKEAAPAAPEPAEAMTLVNFAKTF